MPSPCQICGNPDENRIHKAREMMLGTRDVFEYLECGKCGTLQIVEVQDLSKYYPRHYYSIDPSAPVEVARKFRRRAAAKLVGRFLITGRSPLGKYLSEKRPGVRKLFPKSLLDPILGLNFESKILDFGCGNGQLLRTLYHFGFRDLTGADAFIDSDIAGPGGIMIYKQPLDKLFESFDLIMLNHSFEHLRDPRESLRHIYRLLNANGTALIRIPVVNYAWEKYGVNWVQLDPPRHLFLYTEASFGKIADEAGFHLSKIVYDSEVFQFFGSEQYTMDIAMNDPRSFRGVSETSIFSQEQIDEWTLETEKLNAESRGDQACFYLRKK